MERNANNTSTTINNGSVLASSIILSGVRTDGSTEIINDGSVTSNPMGGQDVTLDLS